MGPTLVPVSQGGASIPAVVLVLDSTVTPADARAMLYQRETGRLDCDNNAPLATWIAELADFAGTSTCLCTALPPNIAPLTAGRLAELAVRSAGAPAGLKHRDGISYLLQQVRRKVMTPLLRPYEEAVLARTGTETLTSAWEQIRSEADRRLPAQLSGPRR